MANYLRRPSSLKARNLWRSMVVHEFKFTPAVSFFVTCETAAEVDELWQKLSEAGTVLMPLDTYPFSEKFGWLEDKYGLSWQLNVGSSSQKIMPFFMYVGDHGQAEEAIKLVYLAVCGFAHSQHRTVW